MEGYHKSSHAIYHCEYHFVWVTKYNYKILTKKIKACLIKILNQFCLWQDIKILKGILSSDYIYMHLSVPPKYSPSQVMKILKGKSAERLSREFPKLLKRYHGLHIWAKGYFVRTVAIDKDIIKDYVKTQREFENKRKSGKSAPKKTIAKKTT